MEGIDEVKNDDQRLKGELFYAFVPKLTETRNRCHSACKRFNSATDTSRRRLVELWKDIIDDKTPLPPIGSTVEEEFRILGDEPYIDGPVTVDYGTNLRLGKGVYINFNCVFLDTCPITIGARTLIGPSCSFYAATHPLDPFLRNGINGPELGAPITVGEDCVRMTTSDGISIRFRNLIPISPNTFPSSTLTVSQWFGGSVIVCPGVSIGRGCTIGAGSIVTKDIPDFHVAAGNPARIIRKIEPKEPDPNLKA